MDDDALTAAYGQVEPELVVQSSDMALMNIASLANSGALDLSPRFQRRNRWDRDRQSRLVESFLQNVPVPPVYLAEEARGVYAVIDGKQRLTAIVNFFNDEFRLSRLVLIPTLEGLSFSELPADVKSKLALRPLRAVTILRQSEDWVKHEVFLRLNTGGEPLNAQEIRNVAFAGPLNDRIIDLAQHPFLVSQLKIQSHNSSAYAKMVDVEAVLRYFALSELWARDLVGYGGNLREALDRFMLQHHRDGASAIKRFEARFLRALHWCQQLWGEEAFRRYDGLQWRDQFIGAIYDAQMIAVDLFEDQELKRIDVKAVKQETANLFTDFEFDDAVRVSTNTSSRLSYRIQAVRQLLSTV